jgi:hypothetical protein
VTHPLRPAGAFQLTKWYLDCVADDGEVFIGYIARLGYGALSIAYASTLRCAPPAPPEARSSLRGGSVSAGSPVGGPSPELDGGAITWSCPALGVAGRWRGCAPPVERTILSTAGGGVVWRCVAPLAEAEISLPGGRQLRGLGYVERLTLTLAPWSMPIDELRWGRFLARDTSLIWIDWRGPHQARIVLHNGEALPDVTVLRTGIEAPLAGISLRLEDPVELRRGALGATALSILPGPTRKAFPGRIFAVDETKWRARGVLCAEGATPRAGWVIHEVVRWP